MKRATVILTTLAGLGAVLHAQSAPTAAQQAQGIVQRYASVLTLSSTQQEQALTIFTAEETTETSVQTAEQTAEKSLVTAIEANDSASIATISATLGGLHGQDVQAQATANALFYAILTTEQQAKFAIFLEQGGDNGGRGGQGGPGGPGGPRR